MDSAHTSPYSILVIEDDQDARGNLTDIIELDGYAVRSTGTFAEAVELGCWSDLLVIILDRRLPDGTAETILPRLRKLAPLTPVIIVTGFADLDGVISAVRHGVVDYIVKPINPEILRSRLTQLVEHRVTKDALAKAEHKVLQSERLAAIGQMMAGLAHESRNALQRSQACLEMLALEVQDRPAAIDLVGRIQLAQDHLYSLYEEVRDYAAPLRLQLRDQDLRPILRRTWEHLSAVRAGRQAELVIEQPGSGGTCCAVDDHALEQVFRNLFENSLSACADPVEIHVRWGSGPPGTEDTLEMTVSDNGPGLTPEARKRIFEPFFTTKVRGTGLGMAITSRIVDAHGGKIAVAPGDCGTHIAISLPRNSG